MCRMNAIAVLLLLAAVTVAGRFSCDNFVSHNCMCSSETSTSFNVVCPNHKLTVHSNFNKVQLQCNLSDGTDDSVDYSVLSGMQFGNVEQFSMFLCPLPETSIRELIDSIGIGTIKMLWIQSSRNLSNTLQKKHLEKLNDVTKLSMNDNGLTSLPVDLFEDMGNLTWLDIKFNNIDLPKEIFYFTPKLEVLELGKNELTHLPTGIFKNLDHLRLLNLWTNNLTNLTRSLFMDVPNLESLDLNTNGMETIRPDLFADLLNLKKLNLYGNAFVSLPQGLLSRNINLEELQMHENKRPIVSLPPGFLANLTKLTTIRLSGCKLNSLPEDIFSGSTNIEKLYLNRNSLKSLAEKTFIDLEDIELLDLSENHITHLPENLFSKTTNLKTLKMNDNQLVEIQSLLFSQLGKLEYLDLRSNRIREVKGDQFSGLQSLKALNLSDNQLVSFATTTQFRDFGNYSVLQNCKSLEDIQLANNSLTEVFADWKMLLNQLHTLNLAFNNINKIEISELDFFSDVTIDLSNNKITLVNFWNSELLARSHVDVFTSPYDRDLNTRQKRIILEDNPFNCDCQLLPFVQFIREELSPEVQYLFQIPSDNLKCHEPKGLEKISLKHAPLSMLTCKFDNVSGYYCPDNCVCEYRTINKGNIINCQGAGLQQIPPYLPVSKIANHTELILDDNRLVSFAIPINRGYENVTHFRLANNNLKFFNVSGFSQKVQVLDVSHNNLTMLPSEVTTFLETAPELEMLLLHNNPWQCNCDALPLVRLLRNKFKQVKQLQNVTCSDGTSLEKLGENQLCPQSASIVIIICVVCAVLSLLLACFITLYYRYRTQIHIYCFSSKWKLLRWMVSHPDIDGDKKYDAFVSFASDDESFVTEQLVPQLEENGDTKFKLCLHYRDFVGGETIPNQILSSIQNSRRTIVVLTPSFLESTWGMVEFITAHSEALQNGTSRVIVILKEDVGPIDDLKDELKAYLQMNTYIKWGSPWFWQQLYFALPHPPEDANDINCIFGCFPRISQDSRTHNVLQNVCLKDGKVQYLTASSDKVSNKDSDNEILSEKKSSPLLIESLDTKPKQLSENDYNNTVPLNV